MLNSVIAIFSVFFINLAKSEWVLVKAFGQNDSCIFIFDSVIKQKLFLNTDEAPEYPGGQSALGIFIAKNFSWPDQSIVQATFNLEFIVDTEGNVIEPRILNKSAEENTKADLEMIRLLKSLPKWKPGRCNGKKVAVLVSLPFRF